MTSSAPRFFKGGAAQHRVVVFTDRAQRGQRTKAPFDEDNVRSALKYAIDREELIEKILHGTGTIGGDYHVSPGTPCYQLIARRHFRLRRHLRVSWRRAHRPFSGSSRHHRRCPIRTFEILPARWPTQLPAAKE